MKHHFKELQEILAKSLVYEKKETINRVNFLLRKIDLEIKIASSKIENKNEFERRAILENMAFNEIPMNKGIYSDYFLNWCVCQGLHADIETHGVYDTFIHLHEMEPDSIEELVEFSKLSEEEIVNLYVNKIKSKQ